MSHARPILRRESNASGVCFGINSFSFETQCVCQNGLKGENCDFCTTLSDCKHSLSVNQVGFIAFVKSRHVKQIRPMCWSLCLKLCLTSRCRRGSLHATERKACCRRILESTTCLSSEWRGTSWNCTSSRRTIPNLR